MTNGDLGLMLSIMIFQFPEAHDPLHLDMELDLKDYSQSVLLNNLCVLFTVYLWIILYTQTTLAEQKPDPTAYQMSSSFSVDTKANAFTFGASRDAYRKVYVRGAKPRDPAIPGPGTYVIPKVTGLEGSRYTFRPKTGILIIYIYIYI